MEPFRFHLFVCAQQKPDGVPSCRACGSQALLDRLDREIQACGLGSEVQITTCGCMGLCDEGPIMIVYPAGLWYRRVQPSDIPEFVAKQLCDGEPVDRLLWKDASAIKAMSAEQTHKFREAMTSHVYELECQVAEQTIEHQRGINYRSSTETDLRIAATAFECQEGMAVTDANTVFLRVNRAFTEITGYSAKEIVGKKAEILRSDRHDAPFYAELTKCVRRHGGWSGEIWERRKNGEVYLVWLTITAVKDDTGKVANYVGTVTDMTEMKKVEEELRESKKLFQLLIEHAPISLLMLDRELRYVAVSRRFLEDTALVGKDIIGRSHYECQPEIPERWREAHRRALAGETVRYEADRFSPADGIELWIQWEAIPWRMANGEVGGIIIVSENITERKVAEEETTRLAFYDPLTSLPNRRLLLDRLKQALASAIRSRCKGALLFIDLDNFKTLNDSLGHDIGDLLLQQVAERLTNCVREVDTVARLGGDEFVVMLEELSESTKDAAVQVEIIGEKILTSLGRSYTLCKHEHLCTASIGAALFGESGENMEELLKQADIAMFRAKAEGRNTLRFFGFNL